MPTVNWTDATIVKERVKGTTLASNAEIDLMIQETEQMICAAVREDLITSITFDAAKHGILRECVNYFVASKVLAENPGSFGSVGEASLVADVYYAIAVKTLEVIKDQKTITYLKGL
jgi:hypothetical protein